MGFRTTGPNPQTSIMTLHLLFAPFQIRMVSSTILFLRKPS